MTVDTRANEKRSTTCRQILTRHGVESPLDFHLAQGVGQIKRTSKAGRFRDIAEQCIGIGNADSRQHGATVGFGMGQVTHMGRPLFVNFGLSPKRVWAAAHTREKVYSKLLT